jgi:hypothetical protein
MAVAGTISNLAFASKTGVGIEWRSRLSIRGEPYRVAT